MNRIALFVGWYGKSEWINYCHKIFLKYINKSSILQNTDIAVLEISLYIAEQMQNYK